MNFDIITKTYIKEFQKVCLESWGTGTKSIEMATRPIVHNYIHSLVDLCKNRDHDVILHHDQHYTSHNRPDWRLEEKDTFGIYCFGDQKNLSVGKPFDLTKVEDSQIARYLAFGRPVFVFDGIEFLFFSSDVKNFKRLSIVNKVSATLAIDWSDLPVNNAVEMFFKNILKNPGFRKWSEDELIDQLALRCRFISDEVASLLNAPLGSGASNNEESLMEDLHKLRSIIVTHHDSSLRNNQACADFISQVLTFGLFYAHTRYADLDSDPKEKSDKIRSFWKIEAENELTSRLRPFKAIVDSLSNPLKEKNALSDWYDEILGVLAHAEYMGTSNGPKDFHILFERFLSIFDPKTKFDRGAFYTPQVLSKWVVSASEEISKKSLGSSILAYTTNIIDPCCGTGSFLEAITSLFSEHPINGNKVIGLEILPAPYALSHYRLSQVYSKDDLNNVKILLADTLADSAYTLPTNIENDFARERQETVSSCKSELRLVIGNPPSSIHPTHNSPRTIIEAMMDDFRPPKLERTDRQNIQKALNNEAYRFLRWCSEKVIESKHGILALVLPGAFAEAVSFNYARKWLISNFKDIYITEIDEDARRGNATQSLFSVRQGRLVLIATYDRMYTYPARIFYSSIGNNSLKDKTRFLSNYPDLDQYKEIVVDESNCRFSSSANFPKDLWLECVPLTHKTERAVFKSKCSAMKLAPTAALFHTNKAILERRTAELGGQVNTTNVLDKWFSGQIKRPQLAKFTEGVKKALSKVNPQTDLKPYLFRPFTDGWVIENEELFSALSLAPGGGTRARPEIRKAFAKNALGIAVAPAPADLGQTLTRFACFNWCLPDNDIAARGNAMIYCNIFPEKRDGGTGKISSNFHKSFLDSFNFSINPEASAIYYVYAVLSSSVYLETFEGALYRHSDPNNPPRIPLAQLEEDRIYISSLGKCIAECERSDFKDSGEANYELDYPTDFIGFKLCRYEYNEREKTIILSSQRDSIKILGVSPEIESLSIAGHSVVNKWIRERMYNYLRRDFNRNDISQLLKLLAAIEVQNHYICSVDQRLAEILDEHRIVRANSGSV